MRFVPARLLVAVEVIAIGVLGAVLGLLVAGTVSIPVGPFETDMELRPTVGGGTSVAVPPLGALQLDTHGGPVHLGLRVTQLRDDAARSIVADPTRLAGLGDEVNSDVRAGLVDLGLRTLLVTLVGAAALGGLVFRRQWRRVLASAGTGLGVLAVAGAWTGVTFDRQALAEPRFTGILALAPTVVGDVRTLVSRFDDYSLQLGRLVSNVSELYTATSQLPTFTAADDTIRVLHVSDLHLNPAAFDVIRSVVAQFQVDVVVDTGDLTDFGSVAEAAYVREIASIPAPYVYVRGNHDSRATQAVLAELPNAVALDGPEVVEVAGVRFLGQGDPRFTPDKTTRDDDAPTEVVLAVGRQLVGAIARAAEPPDIVAVHDPISAEPLRGVTPLVLAGHKHRPDDSTEDGTRLLVQGSTGGAGLRALEGEEPTPITLSVLYLDRETRRLQAYDAITLGGLGTNDARISRSIVEPEPAPTPSLPQVPGTPVPVATPDVSTLPLPTGSPGRIPAPIGTRDPTPSPAAAPSPGPG